MYADTGDGIYQSNSKNATDTLVPAVKNTMRISGQTRKAVSGRHLSLEDITLGNCD